MKRMLSLLLSAALLLTLLLPAAASYPVTVAEVSDEELVEAVIGYLKIKEGTYHSVVRDDNGAVSFGIMMWHGPRALALLRKIAEKIPDKAKSTLGTTFYNEVMNSATNWNSRILTAGEGARLSDFLRTDASKELQEEQAHTDISGYLEAGRKLGLHTASQLFYYADLNNQYGQYGASIILGYARETAGKNSLSEFPNLCEIHVALLHTGYNSVQNYIERRKSTYDYIVKTLGWETTAYYVVYDGAGGTGTPPQPVLLDYGASFTVQSNPYTKTGYRFAGWQARRDLDNCWYVKNVGWCSVGWIAQKGYTICVYEPGTEMTVNRSFSSTGEPYGTYSFVAVWEWVGKTLPAESGGCVHDWRLTGQSTADCTNPGYTAFRCEKCGKTGWDTDVAPTGHSYGSWKISRAATCSREGLRKQTCSVCGVVRTESIPCVAHTPGTPETTAEPTCTQPGVQSTLCKVCGAVLSTTRLPPKGHTPGAAKITAAPTCAAPGRQETACTVCGTVTESVILPETEHDWGEWRIYTEPGETSDGVKARTCGACGETEILVVPGGAHIHSYTETVIPATCTEDGFTLHRCDCGDSYQTDVTEKTGHTLTNAESTATCTEAGMKTGVCAGCGQTLTVHANARGHKWDKGTVTGKATVNAAGERTYLCSRCGAVRTETLQKLTVCPGGDGCISSQFADMPPVSNWAHAGLDFCVEQGLFSGISDTEILPAGEMNRAMLVSVLYRMAGSPAVSGRSGFTDVPPWTWYEKAVVWAAGAKLVAGTGDGKFSPFADVTREQLAVFLFRFTAYTDGSIQARASLSGFSDAASVSDFALKQMSWAVSTGLISGAAENGTLLLKPKAAATRAEVAAILMRYLRKG